MGISSRIVQFPFSQEIFRFKDTVLSSYVSFFCSQLTPNLIVKLLGDSGTRACYKVGGDVARRAMVIKGCPLDHAASTTQTRIPLGMIHLSPITSIYTTDSIEEIV